MAMILQVLAVAVAVGLGVDSSEVPVPQYKYYVNALEEATDMLDRNVLSMRNDVPLLDDYRRHYAEIIHVINTYGAMRSGCFVMDFYEDYYSALESSAPEALNNPELVIAEISSNIDEVIRIVGDVKAIIDSCVDNWYVCDQLVADTIEENKSEYGQSAALLVAAGRVATELNLNNRKYENISKGLRAHHYVSTSPQDLKHIVDVVSDFYRALHPLQKC